MEDQPKKVKYREYDFGEPVTMMSVIGKGYLLNGKTIKPKNSEITLLQLMTRLGKKGWELMSVKENQYYLFKQLTPRPVGTD